MNIKPYTIRVPEGLLNAVRALAKKEERSINKQIVVLLRAAVKGASNDQN